jgi:UMP-CMP kinase
MSFNTSEDVVTDTSLPEFIFMIGGPGAGKGTQCSLLAKKYGFFHFNLGNILRAETSIPGSKWGHIIRRNTLEGAVGSKEMTVDQQCPGDLQPKIHIDRWSDNPFSWQWTL